MPINLRRLSNGCQIARVHAADSFFFIYPWNTEGRKNNKVLFYTFLVYYYDQVRAT